MSKKRRLEMERSAKRPVAVHALSNGFGIEVLECDGERAGWRWSDRGEERVSKVLDGRFRAGRCWWRLDGFERVR